MDRGRPSDRHIPVLDGLRASAIIAVIVCHVNHAYGGPFRSGRIDGPLAMVFGWGWIGVDLFFVLSGFLITGILYDAKGGDGFFRNFYARRALRIMPLYFGFLFVSVLLNRLHCSFAPWVSLDGLVSLVTYTYNLRLAFGGPMLYGLHHFWSLAVEEHFYLLWPLAVWALQRRSLMRLCFSVAAASFLLRVIVALSGARPISAFFFTPCRLDGLLAGSWVALAWREQVDRARMQRWAVQFALGSGFLLLGIALGQRHFIPDVNLIRTPEAGVDGKLVITVGIAALAVFFASLIVMTLDAPENSRLRRLLEGDGLRSIGKYSYAIYMFHALILSATVQFVTPLSHIPAYVAKPVAVIWVLAASFVAAWMSYHLYEKQFLRLKRHFAYRETAESTTPVPSQGVSYSNA